jgi:signal transduction histidine kinase
MNLKSTFILLFFFKNIPLLLANPNIDSLVVIDDGFENVHFHQKVFQWNKTKSVNAFSEVIQAPTSDFVQNKLSQEVNFGYNQTDGWSKFNLKNNSNKDNIFLVVQQSRLDNIKVFVQRGSQIDTLQLLGKNIPSYFRKVHSNDFVYNIPIKKDEIITCFLYSYRKFGHHACILSISDDTYFNQHERIFSFELALIIGVCLLAVLICFSLFWFVREKIYLFYGLYAGSYILLFLADGGFLHSFLHLPKFQFQINYATTIVYFFVVGLHLLFVTELLNLASIRRWFYHFGITSMLFFWGVALCLTLLPLPKQVIWWIIYLSYFLLFYSDLYILIAIGISFSKRQPITYFYLTGFLLTLCVWTTLILANVGIIDGVNQNTDIYYLTPLVEILIMVIGFSFRFSKSLKEKFQIQLDLTKNQQAIISTQENERKRIGQDLHDDVGNTLAALKNVVSNRYGHDFETNDMIDKTIEQVRQISHNLMPIDFEKHELSEVLQQTTRKLNNKNIKIQFIEAGKKLLIKPVIALEIYRIFNEILNNINRHSGASTAVCQIIYQKNSLVLSIEDNGNGFNLSEILANTEGIGLKNLYARAEIIGAKLTIQSDEKGTLTILDLPIKPSL